jgi:physarolisin II. Serine peptidase. MEROPS family S53
LHACRSTLEDPPDVYYALGAAEGITFLAASGDGGGMGYSAGPVGDVSYPASSPWVLAVGGTTTYLNLYPNGSVSSYYSTAWSAAGFVPYMQNFGGSTGGYSAYEPMPWWQEGVVPTPPQGFPYGRAVPDVSANANIFPGAIMVTEDNETVLAGGTSEASQLTAGLLALVEEYVGHRLGLVAPTLYSLYSNSSTRNAFIPITFGYNIRVPSSNS